MRILPATIIVSATAAVVAMVVALLQAPEQPVTSATIVAQAEPVADLPRLATERTENPQPLQPEQQANPLEELTTIEQLNLLRIDDSEWDDYDQALALLAQLLSTDPDAALDWALTLAPNQEAEQIQYEFLVQLSTVKPAMAYANFELLPVSRFSKQLVRELSVKQSQQSFQAAMDWVNTLPNAELVSAGRWALYKNGLAESPLDIIDTVMIDDSLDSYRQQALLHRAFSAQLALDSDFANTPLSYYSEAIQPALISALLENGQTIEGMPADQWLQTQNASPRKDRALVALSNQGGSYQKRFSYLADVSSSSLRQEQLTMVLKLWSAAEPTQARQALDQSGLPQEDIDAIWARVSS